MSKKQTITVKSRQAGYTRKTQLDSESLCIRESISVGIGACLTIEHAAEIAAHHNLTTWQALAAKFGGTYRTIRGGRILLLLPLPCPSALA